LIGLKQQNEFMVQGQKIDMKSSPGKVDPPLKVDKPVNESRLRQMKKENNEFEKQKQLIEM